MSTDQRPWMDPSQPPSARARLLVAAMTTEQKIAQLRGATETIDIYSIDPHADDSAFLSELKRQALAVALRAKNVAYRSFSVTASATALLGVPQPALYGNALPLRRPLFAVMAGGASGGLVAGLTGFKVFALMPAGLTAIPVYVDESGWSNLLLGAAVMITAFLVSFAGAWFLGYEQPDQGTVDEVTGAEKK